MDALLPLANIVGARLKARGETIGIAESSRVSLFWIACWAVIFQSTRGHAG